MNQYVPIPEADCPILYTPIETVGELVAYRPCNHFFSADSVAHSCRSMMEVGLHAKVTKCDVCIANALEPAG